MKKFIQIVLWVNLAITAVVGVTGYVLHVGPAGGIPATEPIVGHEVFAYQVGVILTLLIILRRFQRDPVWLLVPVVFLVPLWIDAVYELSVGTYPIPPVILRPIFVTCYLVGFARLRSAARGGSETVVVKEG